MKEIVLTEWESYCPGDMTYYIVITRNMLVMAIEH